MSTKEDINEIEDIQKLEDDEPEKRKGKFKKLTPPVHQLNLDYSQESLYATNAKDFDLKRGDLVLVPTRYGMDVARFSGEVNSPLHIHSDSIVKIVSKVTGESFHILKENKRKEEHGAKVFKEKVALNNLNMKFVGCHFLFGEPKVLFFFSADTRIDFRQLVKDLVSVFKIRVELRQIGVRDESKILGGLGFCGRPYCCHSVTDKLSSVSIKMAKEQSVSLNSTKISGQCGRLLCCLAYEYEWYTEAKKNLPPEDIKLPYDGTVFKVTSVNPLTEMVSLDGADGRLLSIPAKRFVKQLGKWKIK